MKLFALLCFAAAVTARAESARIIKVLPSFLDEKGRHALHPSLYERDAYQSKLRRNPQLRSALRFDVQWKVSGAEQVKIRVEARGNKEGQPQQAVIETTAKKPALFSRWTQLKLDGAAYKQFGELAAWRVTVWSGDQQLAEQKSFLW
ncbi:MAG: hypothetical protein HZA90_05935 [Verrucomicrobia bacterium]|nr:hypothetical protein [Verrucomicrobiota bacterium]